MLTKEQYIADPCRASSVPYWKAKDLTIPEGMLVLHQDELDGIDLGSYEDETYFRLRHDLRDLPAPRLPDGFSLCRPTLGEYAAHIALCYGGPCVSEAELRSYTTRPVYREELWLAVREDRTGAIAASGIAELDREAGEGALEWIQVAEPYRRRGLGRYVVTELLRRMKGLARFATVSGQCGNRSNPEALYRACGFTGADVWHILRKVDP